MGVSPKTYLQLLTVERTAGILGVSAATVRNWVRCGRIVPGKGSLFFLERKGQKIFSYLKSRYIPRSGDCAVRESSLPLPA